MYSAILHGFILAFGLILPLGVQNVFVFNQGAIQPRWIYVLPVVLTASICDTILISLAVFGVSAVVLGVPWIKVTLLLIGVLFLIYMGYSTWKSQAQMQEANSQTFTPRKQVMFAASVSLLNPHAIMDTIGVIGTSSLSYTGVEKFSFTLSCIFVSWVWFFGLSLVGRVVGKLDHTGRFIVILNKISAIIMWGTAVYLILSLLYF
ncbi:L-lysine exporter family protein LysE/ArgO [Bacillus sp. SORGH_AS 510]|uniref:LysE/ArgO family amino acid transporter n=1 Tax=Bacillus sp. SORGH_AS_0510 TaxID=3041771 RepID=UPI002785863B|nr:LysE/ArgO family amino acid transporter [Bacillus sp. SORGH_AS_0510]MDQ1146413.1 L-lysine exporter family protein LysE/ArgO [Bacillus sp. SORGH_AS_0510]